MASWKEEVQMETVVSYVVFSGTVCPASCNVFRGEFASEDAAVAEAKRWAFATVSRKEIASRLDRVLDWAKPARDKRRGR